MKPVSKRDIDILEERGHWVASSWLYKLIEKLIRKNLPVELRYIKEAHRLMFQKANQGGIAGKYRNHNGPELRRVDGTVLKMADWHNIPNILAKIDVELREFTKNLQPPKNESEYRQIILEAARLSHQLASVHPFVNGNGRASRLLMNAILKRAGLPVIAIKKSKKSYLMAMRQADDGDPSLLEDLIVSGLLENKRQNYNTVSKYRN